MSRGGQTTRIVFGVFTLAGALCGANHWWRMSTQERSRTTCKLNLKAIGAALHAYHDSIGTFPAAFSAGDVPHSWRVTLLPWIGQAELHAGYDFRVPWDRETNRAILKSRPAQYACPDVIDGTRTSYQAVVGIQTVWPFDQSASIRNITDGTSNTIMLLDVHSPEVPWTQPRDVSFAEAINAIPREHAHDRSAATGGTNVLYSDGSVRFLSQTIDADIVRKLLTASSGSPVGNSPLSRHGSEQLRKEYSEITAHQFASPISADSLSATQVSAFADVDILNGHTVIYCPTMTLAWKQYVELNPQVKLTESGRKLLANSFSPSDIEPEAIRIVAGQLNGDAIRSVRDEFLGPEAGEHRLKSASGETPFGPSVWCALKKQLAFISRFEAFKQPLAFNGPTGATNVKSFGVTSHWDDWRNALAQIRVADYRSPDDFIILIGNLSGENLILAKIPQPATLANGIDDVSNRIRDSRIAPEARSVVAHEQVVIPILEMSLLREFTSELNHPEQPLGSRVDSAMQVIQFRLDEQGALLISESEVIGENGHYELAVGERTFIFNKPFLVMLRESPMKQPYLATWISNTDLMVPHE